MLSEILQLNKIYKCNDFTQIKARYVLQPDLRVIFIRDPQSSKLGTVISELKPEQMPSLQQQNFALDDEEVLRYFDMDAEYVKNEGSFTFVQSSSSKEFENYLLHEALKLSALHFCFHAF